ncbi:DedA family protein [bacterium]|nr:DedA family protein [bacterium]
MFEYFNIEQWIQTIEGFDTSLIYVIIFLSGYLENCIPPIPGDSVTVFAAIMVGTGRLNYVAVFITATAGNLAGFMTMYQVGRYLGKKFFLEKNYKFFPRERIEKTEAWFSKYGYRIILFNRFLSGFRSVISVFAGMTHLQRRKIIPLAFLSACMWDGVIIYGGYLVGDNFDVILNRYNAVVLTIVILVIIIFLLRKIIIHSQSKPGHS